MSSFLINARRGARASTSIFRQYFSRRPSVWFTSLELGAVVIFALWIGIALKHLENRRIDFDGAKRDLQNFSLLLEDSVLRSIEELDKALLYLRNSIQKTGNAIDYNKIVGTSDILSSLIVQVAIIDADGIMRASNIGPQPAPAIDLSDREHFIFHVNNVTDTIFISKPVIGRVSGKWSVQLTRRYLKANGQFGGVVVASFDPSHFKNLFSLVDLGPGAVYSLIGIDGIIRAVGGQPRPEFGLGQDLSQVVQFERLENRVSDTFWGPFTAGGARDLIVLRRVAGHPLRVAARIPYETVYKDATHHLLMMSSIGGLLSLLIWFGARRAWGIELQGHQRAAELFSTNVALRESHEQLGNLVSDIKRSEADARHQQLLFQSVFQSTPDGLVLVDFDRKVVNINPGFSQIFGYTIEDLRGHSSECLYQAEVDYDTVSAHIEAGLIGPILNAVHCVRKNGEVFPIQMTVSELVSPSGAVLGHLGVIRDVAIEQKREGALREKQRIEALGRLTGGIAHDFNNLLTVISGNLQLVRMDPDPERRMRYLAESELAIDMGARLNQRLMTFANQRNLDPVPVDLNDLLNGMLDLVQRSIGEKIYMTANLAASLPVVRLDASEMESALLNLALNARDAMENGGELSIGTSNVHIDALDISQGDLEPGKYVQLVVTDTGAGMSEEVLSRAFEPFFTTKSDGKGTGLGLTTIHGFIKQSGGFVRLASKPGHGTSVSIYLPSLETENNIGSSPGKLQSKARGSGEFILLVEDNPAVRRVTMERLQVLGYRVIESASGFEALDVISRGKPIDLVFSDIVMPGGVSGFELAKRLSQTRPELRVLLTSGFPDELARQEAPDLKRRVVLRKPYSQDELARAMSEALEN
jgi:PAS domain S-box-containing protein